MLASACRATVVALVFGSPLAIAAPPHVDVHLRPLASVATPDGRRTPSATTAASTSASPVAFTSAHATRIAGQPVRFTATVEDFVVRDRSGVPGARLFSTSYVRSDVRDPSARPVVFMFNGGPSFAAIGVHMQFGPIHEAPESEGTGPAAGDAPLRGSSTTPPPIRFAANPDSLLDAADLVVFDPAETGFSRVLRDEARPYFYSVQGDADSLAQLVVQWIERHGRRASPLYLLGESYGSIRQTVAGAILRERGVPLRGQVIFGESLFLTETSRRSHNIVSTAVSLPLLALTAAYHGKADRRGRTDAQLLDEVYAFAIGEYLVALAKGASLTAVERSAMAAKLEAYTGIPAAYYERNGLAIAKQEFNRRLLDGKLLNANDTRIATPLPRPPKNQAEASRQQIGDLLDPYERRYRAYMANELGVRLPGIEYRIQAPESFEAWNWGGGCSPMLSTAGLCNPAGTQPTPFNDYDWPDVLRRQFDDPAFRTMVVAGYYDGLSSIGTHRYLASQLYFPADRFEIREYPAGHMTAEDAAVRPQVLKDVRDFLMRPPPASR
jgi:carboxypeptidase C (cathepsin A)